jgi:hypothetical protein
MMAVHLSDFVTGLSLPSGSPVVALVLSRKVGGYPDATTAAARPGLHPSQIFEPVSLPIRGKYSEGGRVAVDESQIGVKLCCKMVGAKDWSEFQETALNWERGAVMRRDTKPTRSNSVMEDTEIFGLALMHTITWDRLMSMDPDRVSKDVDLKILKVALLDAAERATDLGDAGGGLLRAIDLLRLSSNKAWRLDSGTELALPSMAGCLAQNGPIGKRFSDWLIGPTGQMGIRNAEIIANDEGGWIQDFLSGLWDLIEIQKILSHINRIFIPSVSSDGSNHKYEGGVLAMSVLEQSYSAMLGDLQGRGREAAIEHLESLIVRMTKVRDGVEKHLRFLQQTPNQGGGGR